MLFVGPNDLASSLGYVAGDHPDIPEVQEAIARVLKACQSAGKYSGMVSLNYFPVNWRKAQDRDLTSFAVLYKWRTSQSQIRARMYVSLDSSAPVLPRQCSNMS